MLRSAIRMIHTLFTHKYFQFERKRLNLPLDAPIVVQQWSGLIAISYPARAYGITRHENIFEVCLAMLHLCHQLIKQRQKRNARTLYLFMWLHTRRGKKNLAIGMKSPTQTVTK